MTPAWTRALGRILPRVDGRPILVLGGEPISGYLPFVWRLVRSAGVLSAPVAEPFDVIHEALSDERLIGQALLNARELPFCFE